MLSNPILFLHALSAKRPLGRRKTEDDIVVKLLALFTPALCLTISTMCMVVKLLALFTPELCLTISTMCMVELIAAEAKWRPSLLATFNMGGISRRAS